MMAGCRRTGAREGDCLMNRLGLLCAAAVTLAMPSGGQWRPKDTEWPAYTADLAGTRYRPLDQINASNFSKLEVAWRFKTDNLGTRPEYKLEGTPLMVNGVIYATAGTRRAVVALDARTGEMIWVHSVREGKRAALSPRQLSGRGLAYWSDGRGDDRVIYVTTGYRLIALNAKTGQITPSFGKDGRRRPEAGMYTGTGQQIDLETGEVGTALGPDGRERRGDRRLGDERGHDRRHAQQHQGPGARLRRAHRQAAVDLPHHPEAGRVRQRHLGERVLGDEWEHRRLDPDHGRRRSSDWSTCRWNRPPSDFYGGHRPGNNLFGESLVCVDLKTGQAQMALPDRAPSDLGLRPFLRADSGRYQRQRQSDQSGRACRPSSPGSMCSTG